MVHPEGDPWPAERSGHAAVGLGEDHLLVTGGLANDGKVLGDFWLLDVRSGRWREVRIRDISYIILYIIP